MEEGNATSAFFLDFSKAFDCLDHTLLLKKMEKMGVRGKAKEWMSSYLKDRSQMVEIAYTSSKTIYKVTSMQLPVNRGVPQGSVLGPVLFILLTNDLPKQLQDYSQVMMFADDTALVVAKKQPSELEVSSYVALNMAKQYCHANDLVLNTSKTQQINFGQMTTGLNWLPEVEHKTEAKYLGVIIDSKLTWTSHVDQVCGKLSSGLYVIKKLKNTCNMDTARTAYFSLFESHLRYGLLVWGNSSSRNLQRVLVLQKKAVRILAGLKPLDSCRAAFEDLKILTVASLYISEVTCHAVSQNLSKLGETHSYNTRNANDFSLPTHHLTKYEKKPSYIGSKLYNLLPDHLKKICKEKSFKQKLQEWLLKWSFYSIEEFTSWKNYQVKEL